MAFEDSKVRIGMVGIGRLIPITVRAVTFHVDISEVFRTIRFTDAYRKRTLIVVYLDLASSVEIDFLVHLKHAFSGLGEN